MPSLLASRTLDPAVVAVEDRLYRALAVLRIVVLLNAIALNVHRANFSHPRLGVAVLVAMGAWTAFAIWAYAAPQRRVPALLIADMTMTVASLLSTLVVKGPWFNASVPGFWVAGALLACAVQWRWRGGLVAAAVISTVDLAIRDHITQTNYANVFLLMIAGPIVGYLCGSLQEMAASRAAAERAAAAAAERARLARVVHDGVLQVLALVQRRGTELGGPAAELGALAGEQEQALRTLIRQQDTSAAPWSAVADLVGALEQVAASSGLRVETSGPGGPVEMARGTVDEIAAVATECLANVARHVGSDARAWVLVESLSDQVVVTIRDEGPGIPAGRLEAAAAEGRLGVVESIRGRIRDLGGEALLFTDTGLGVEWEFTVPRRAPA
ncbi:MacS family sensor histidine kinase [Nocardioides daejeonensis]|uniref:MacS family sensor histidine kinase n=1 Tax=Nocardioides daejeonensis TaxID=1046556 RepID=UPI000D7496D3|nr:DUF5931 domain-containing protein [Nocardioides daejeonensis]